MIRRLCTAVFNPAKTSGLRKMFLATTFFAGTNLCVKYLSHVPFFQVALYRSLFAFVFCVVYFRWHRMSPWGHDRKTLFARGLFGTMGLSLFFFSLQVLPLATAVTLQYMAPLFTVFIAGLFLGEKAKPIQWLFFVMAFVGVIFIRGFEYQEPLLYIGLGLLGALSAAIAYNLIRFMTNKEHPMVVIFYLPLVTIPILGGVTAFYGVMPQWKDLPAVFGVGVFTQIAQWFMTRAYQMERADKVGIVSYVGVVYALAFGVIIFDEVPGWSGVLGVLIIITSVVLNKRKGQRD